MNGLLDVEAQRKLAVKSLFESQGYNLFKEELDNFTVYLDSCIQSHQEDGCISAMKLDKLNYDLGRKQGLRMVLNVLEQFREELEG